MPADLLFSFGIVMPLFMMLLLGYGLKRINLISDAFSANGNKMMFYIGLPVIVFRSIYYTDMRELFDPRFVIAMLAVTLITGAMIWFAASLVIKEKPVRGAFALSAFRGNQAFLGIPLLTMLAGDAGLIRATMVVTFVMPVANVLSIFIMAFTGDKGKKISPAYIARTIITNPIIIVTVLGLVWVLWLPAVRLPGVMETTLNYIAEMATPLALLCIGASMRFAGFDKKFGFAVTASVIKIIILPLIFAGVGYVLGFRGYDLAAMTIMGGVPSAIAGYAMVVEMGGDSYTAGTVVVISTLFSAFTLTLIIYAIRVLGAL
jgi:hypothetical protein